MILDTCALLWLATGSKRLSRKVLTEMDNAPAVHVSAISGFEIALKAARGKLQLPLPSPEWLAQVIAHHNLCVLPLDLDTCVRAALLPAVHDDPCDRFIIATAMLHELPVVTADERFEAYGVRVLL